MALFERYRNLGSSEETANPVPDPKSGDTTPSKTRTWYEGAKGAVKGAVNGAKNGAKEGAAKAKLEAPQPTPPPAPAAKRNLKNRAGEEWQKEMEDVCALGLYARQYLRGVLAKYDEQDRQDLLDLAADATDTENQHKAGRKAS